MADIAARKIKTPFDFEMRLGFDFLRQKLAKHHLLGKILRTNHRMVRARRRKRNHRNPQRQDCCQPQDPPHGTGTLYLRSNNPSTASAVSASKAAGTAPPSKSRLSTEATPRKISSPSPPAPTAAAIVAMPM